ncbi:hypothetical protein L218DRAFT_309557 [Marasmius fiardii PR-910]|nr:hypothetical protein L218DRAFT_309557 [Marasmius fiardii PR-910]
MRELPPEIFTLVVESNAFGRINCHRPRQFGASFLTKICSRWRAVALSTPEIWARISIEHDRDLPIIDVCPTEKEQERLKLCLERAKSFPLSVRVSLDLDGEVLEDEDTTEYTTLLWELMGSDWETLTARMDSVSADICKSIIEVIAGKLGLLRRLEADFRCINDMEPLRTWQSLVTFPNLQTLRLSHRPIFPVLSSISFRTIVNLIFPYSRLTLGLEVTPTEELEVLRLCSQRLCSFQIDGSNFSPRYHTIIIPPLTLTLLNSLIIDSPFMTNVQNFVNALTTPALSSVMLRRRLHRGKKIFVFVFSSIDESIATVQSFS